MSDIEQRNSVFYIYNSFKNGLFYKMKERKIEKCWFDHYNELLNNGTFYFKAISKADYREYNVSVSIDKYNYEYYDELVEIFISHVNWLFEIGEYNYITDTFDIIFKRYNYKGYEKESYRISSYGIIRGNYFIDTDVTYYMDTDARYVHEALRSTMNSVYGLDCFDPLGLPVCKELPTFKFDSQFGYIPTLSKSPIFNPPATICYWTDGTKTIVKCQEEDTYSPEAGLALCYMKKVLGNTSRDLNKELHKYIPEEKEDE